MDCIVLHIRGRFLHDDFSRKHLRLFSFIEEICAAAGVACERRTRPEAYEAGLAFDDPLGVFEEGALHVVDHGSIRAPHVLNAALAYIDDFWQLDPMGIRAFHSAAQAQYDPATVPFDTAQPFFQKLRRARVNHRHSRYDQPHRWEEFPKGSTAVFLQGEMPRLTGTTQFTDLDMLRTVMSHTDGPVLVKPHPLVADLSVVQTALNWAQDDPRIIVTDANVHDLLRACDVSVSINSTVALEGFLHRKPAILFGKSDFHHMVGTVEHLDAFPQIYAQERARTKGFQQYIAWYFQNHCYDITAVDLEEQLWACFARFGLHRAAP